MRVLPFILAAATVAAQAPDPRSAVTPIHVMVLGTFHFDDPGLDDYVPQFPWDPTTPAHQREIAEVLDRLARLAPTRIALEWPGEAQERLDSLYRAFLAGAPANANERQQLGFRLAQRLGHARVYAVDASARSYFPNMTQEEYEARVARLLEGVDPRALAQQQALEAAYEAAARYDDSLKTVQPLRAYLLSINASAAVRQDHGQYLIGGFLLGRDGDYLGPDMRTQWFNRNLRIVMNIRRVSEPGDRVLVIMGAGHLALLRHALEASPEFALVEVETYLGEVR